MGSQFMRQLKIGYQPLSATLKAAGDRRRLLFWAKNRGHEIVIDLSQKVDVLIASENADFQSPHFNQRGVPVIFDLVDAYLSPLNPWDDFARGLAKKLSGQISGKVQPFSHHVRDFCFKSDAVICSSPEQEVVIKPFNSNTHIILDSHDEIPLIDPKLIGKTPPSEKIILWEGQPATIRGVQQISSILFQLAKESDLHFDFVTDEKYFQLLGKYFKMDTLKLLEKDLGPIIDRIRIIPWTSNNLVASAKKSSISMIPIDLSVPMQKLKPENRLLIMWRLGLPCLTSPSPAYTRVANKAGVRAVCDNPKAWHENFTNLLNDPTFAFEEVLRGQNYLHEHHNRESLLNKWDQAIESVIG
jgi:hypothetical protein